MKLSIIIPNYNGHHFLSDCLASLKQQTFTDFEIILVDNGSTDESLPYIKKNYPEIRVIALSKNMGFSVAANKGILASKCPYVMLLNNDTILAPDCLEILMAQMKKNASAFSVGARVLSLHSPQLTDTDGDHYSLMGYAFCLRQGLPARTDLTKPYPVFTNCACCCIYRKSLLGRTGLFDESFFAYLEDVDIGFRARRLGFSNILCPKAVIWHVGSGTTRAKYTSFKVFHSARNNLLLSHKNLTFLQKVLHFPFYIVGILLKYHYFHRYGLEKAYQKGCAAGIRTCTRKNSQLMFLSHAGKRSVAPRRSFRKSFTSFLRTEPWIIGGTLLYVMQYVKRRTKMNVHWTFT